MTPVLVTALAVSTAAVATYGLLTLLRSPRAAEPKEGTDSPGPVLPAIALGVVVFAVLTVLVPTSSQVRHWDMVVAGWAADHVPAAIGSAAAGLTHLADTPVYIATTVLAAVLLLSARHARLAGFVVTVAVGQWVLSNQVKHLVGRDRPDLHRLVDASGFSFPSGHATAAASLFLALALVVIALRPQWSRRLVLSIGLAMGVAVAATRVLVGVHWTTDVLAGLALGWAWCLVCAAIFGVVADLTSRSERSER